MNQHCFYFLCHLIKLLVNLKIVTSTNALFALYFNRITPLIILKVCVAPDRSQVLVISIPLTIHVHFLFISSSSSATYYDGRSLATLGTKVSYLIFYCCFPYASIFGQCCVPITHNIEITVLCLRFSSSCRVRM